MNLWTAIVVIVALGCLTRIIKERHRSQPGQSDETMNEVLQRLDRLEKRIGNLETIVLDKEKARAWEKL